MTLRERYARWAGLARPWEPRRGWRWMIALHLLVACSAVFWLALVLAVFA